MKVPLAKVTKAGLKVTKGSPKVMNATGGECTADDAPWDPKNPPSIREGGFPPSYQSLNFTRCSLRAFRTTDTELNAIAAPATHGARKPAAAIGMPTEL